MRRQELSPNPWQIEWSAPPRNPGGEEDRAMAASGQRSGIVTLLTDFGMAEPYVGIMKGVMLGIGPALRLVDLTHEVPPGDVEDAACLLGAAWPYFPVGTVHLVVVDPGVGSDRAAIAVEAAGHLFVGPDNGVLAPALEADAGARAVRLEAERFFLSPVSATFHGRDVFAPVAARLALGAPIGDLGPAARPAMATRPQVEWIGGRLLARVVHIDRFGNLMTGAREQDVDDVGPRADLRVIVGGASITGVLRTYADVAPGEPVAYIGSDGRMEIGVRGGSAAAALGAHRGDGVTVERREP